MLYEVITRLFPDAARNCIEAGGGEVRLSARVNALHPTLTIGDETFAHVVIATAPQHASPLLRGFPETEEIARQLDGYTFEPIGTVYLGYPEALSSPFPMLGLETLKPNRIGQWAFVRSEEGGGQGIAACVLSGEGRVITSYSIHYTKLYERMTWCQSGVGRGRPSVF